MRTLVLMGWLGLACFTAGCKATGGEAASDSRASEIGVAVSVGASLIDEPCKAKGRRARPGDRTDELPLEIFCAGLDERPGAVVYVTNLPTGAGDSATGREAIERASRGSTTGRDIAQRLSCQPGQWGGFVGVDVYLAPCTQRSGNLPTMLSAAAYKGRLLLAEGFPTLLPAIVAGMRVRAGDDAPGAIADAPTRAAMVTQLKQLFSSAVLEIPARDVIGFQEQLEEARLANSTQTYAQAEAALRRALDLQSRLLPPDDPGVGETLMNLALEVSNQGRFGEADALFRRADPILQRSVRQEDYATFLSYTAMHAANQRNFQRALTLIRDVTSRRRALAGQGGSVIGGGQQGTSGDLAHGLMLEAAIALRLGQIAGAEAALGEARRLLDETAGLPPWWRPQLETVSGELSQRRGQVEVAERALTQAVDQKRGLFGATWPTAAALIELGRFRAQTKRNADAVATYREAFKVMSEDSSRRPDVLFEQIVPFLNAAAGLAQQDPAKRDVLLADMFRANQLTRDGVAGQTIAQTTARLATDDPKVAGLLREQQEASRERDTLQLELATEVSRPDDRRDRGREAELRRSLTTTSKKAEELDAAIKVAFPGYDKLLAPKAVELDDVRKRLDPGEALALFAFGRDLGFAFIVKRDAVYAEPLALSEGDIQLEVTELRKAFIGRDGVVGPYDTRAAYRLFDGLFGGFEAALADVKHLIIVPAGALSSLPPALLVSEDPAAGTEIDYRRVAFLPRRMATSIAPSVRAFVDLRGLRGRARAPRPFLGFGNPTFLGTPAGGAAGQPVGLDALSQDCRAGAPLNPALLRGLAPLPETADEVRRIATVLRATPDSVILGADVNDNTVRARELGQYRVLYFATHGLLPGELRCQGEPGLALSPPVGQPDSVENDGLLSTSKIARLRLNADLVVLSACNTGGSGGKFGGGALSGLAESFFYAGARSLLVSHWQVPSVPTVALTTGMFERLGPDLARGAAEALRGSQIALLDAPATAHPYFWAAFTLVGEAGGPGATTAAVPPTSGGKVLAGAGAS